MSEEITTKSWGSRIVGALWGVIIGFALIIGAFILIFWNESHGLHTAQALDHALKVHVNIKPDSIDEKNNQKVVYFTGMATTENELSDPILNVTEKAIKLNRSVLMYQWEQNVSTKTEKQVGGSEREVKSYSYKKVWSDKLIDSSEFHDKEGHENPQKMPIKSYEKFAEYVTVGEFHLPESLVSQIQGAKSIDLSNVELAKLEEKTDKPVKHNGEDIYIGKDVDAPEIGDVKISMSEVLPQTVSVMAEQNGTTLQPFMAPSGQEVSLLMMGTHSAEALIEDAKSSNNMMTWLIRLGSLVMMIFGLALLMNPLVVLADFIPIFGSIVGVGTGLIAVAGGLCLWGIATAIAWFATRPIWAVGLIVIVGCVAYGLIRMKKKKNEVAA